MSTTANIDACLRVLADPVKINAYRKKLASESYALMKMSRLLALVSNEVRLKLCFLLKEEELCPCDLADMLGMNLSAISQHLRKMKDGGLIEARRSGQTIFYALSIEYRELLYLLLQYSHKI